MSVFLEYNDSMEKIRPGKYRHYKGKFYQAIDIAINSETLEEMVIYQALYHSKKFGKNAMWVRPKKKFLGKVIFKGKRVKRFGYTDD